MAEHVCIKLVPALNKEFQKRIATRLFHLNVKENQHATNRSLLVEKQKDFFRLRACSHGGGGPRVGEVPHLPVVKES